MSSKTQFEIEADQVHIKDLWRALTKDKVEILEKAAPDLLTELRILEGDGIGLGSLIYVSFVPSGAAAPAVLEPFKERIVECDETKHLLSFLGIEGGYMNLGFTHYLVSFKLDDIGAGKTLITSSLTYDLEQNIDRAQLLDGFLNLLRYYLGSVVKYLQKLQNDPESDEGGL
ncbi:hypothetical protein KSP39_PZI009287 [Platanthera zijinensis]|uniref:Bet v I/Major latex protein domain-containing protein n=1 Tax=Platanthera zijinensis TaxID=2320716 RepID=A0AAP0BKV5_9ASPA